MSERIVLDSQALVAFLYDEHGAGRVQSALAERETWMTLVNLGEVLYVVERLAGEEAAHTVYANLADGDKRNQPIAIHWFPVDLPLVRRAASIKARGGLSYADCFAAAAAEQLQCPVLTGDREFQRVEALGIAVEWISG